MQPPRDQRYYRGSDRIVGGVCSGLAEGLHIDTIWVRVAFVVLAFVQGIGVLIYAVLWVIMPERTQDRPAGRSAFDSMADDVKRAWPTFEVNSAAGRQPARLLIRQQCRRHLRCRQIRARLYRPRQRRWSRRPRPRLQAHLSHPRRHGPPCTTKLFFWA
jgi:phage shock protein PspC (stress-responsive transcriptional regulator)